MKIRKAMLKALTKGSKEIRRTSWFYDKIRLNGDGTFSWIRCQKDTGNCFELAWAIKQEDIFAEDWEVVI